MTAYYSENDPKAAAWLRELIRADVIASGVVDERDIEDVTPADLVGFTQCHFFAGIGGWSYALRLAGWPDDQPVWTGSCPCQPFSAAGRNQGFDDKRHLWPIWRALLEQCRPATVFGEQVSSPPALGWLALVQDDLEGKGYAVASADLCAAGLGAPHIRQRLFWVAESNSGQCDRRTIAPARDFAHGADSGRSQGDSGAAPDSETGELAESRRERCEGLGLHLQPGSPRLDVTEARRGGEAGIALGNASSPGLSQRVGNGCLQRQTLGTSSGQAVVSSGDAGELGDAGRPGGRGDAGALPREEGGPERSLRGESDESELADPTCETAHTDEPRSLSGSHSGVHRLQEGVGSRDAEPERRGATDFWSDCDWIACRDGKSRPTQPGSFPLVARVSGKLGRLRDPSEPIDPNNSAEARVMRLRGYGNSIVPQVAAAFIQAYCDSKQY